ncbi:hypothetical protein CIG75_11110 [Tumebacillus algifaecis]|uniref:DUF7408 domain-containing protein n=1 Tax=Tumebacillus algifaecis TaxID=1214604 RepID=A0A223D1P3_9BACL|nr:hypothetical protein [Tumebacillus algifaecis]ASS75471.1 hypothetical protein CIG75_11110 [Tumebacillus algifaecis]
MRKRKRTWRFAAVAVTTACLLTSLAGTTLADAEVKMNVQYGFDGSFKAGTWTLVQVMLENQEGPDFQGHVEIVERDAQYGTPSGHYGSFTKPVVLPKGTTKQVLLEVPASYLYQPVNVKLVDEKGKVEASYSSGIGKPMENQLLIGAVAAKENDLTFLTKSSGPGIGDRVYVRSLDGTNLPERADLLKSLDVLVINHAPKEKWTVEQMAAIKTWVQGGGNLVLSGGAQYPGGAGQFTDLSPVAISGTKEVSDLSGLEQLAGQKPNVETITVTDARLKQGAKALIQSGDMPLIAWQHVGAGKVFYAGYDLSVEPLASWAGNEELWKRVLAERVVSSSIIAQSDRYDQFPYLASTAASFPNLVPSVQVMALAFGVYVLIAAPGLYLFLRRKNRSEWAWGLIPVTSILFAAGIFGFGSLERGTGPITQTLGEIQLKGQDVANVLAVASFVVPNGGEYSVEALEGGRIAPINSQRYINERSPKSQIVQSGDQQSVRFKEVDYFSSREAELTTTLSGLGLVESDLKLDATGRITGTLVNKSKLDLERTYLLLGDSAIEVGDLKAGASKSVDATYQYSAPSAGMGMFQMTRDRLINPTYSQFGLSRDIEEERRRALVDFGLLPYQMGQGELTLIGFSSTAFDLYTVNGDKPRTEMRSLVTQELNLAHSSGQMKWPLGLVRPKMIATDGDVINRNIELILNGGSIDLEYNLKQASGFVPEKAMIDLDESMFSLLEKRYFNWQTQQWDKVSGELLTALTSADLKKYMSPDGMFRVQLQGNSQLASGPFLHFPSMGVEGLVSP